MDEFMVTVQNDKQLITFSSSYINIDKAVKEIIAFLTERNAVEFTEFDAALILREGLTNAVEHGNNNDSSLKVIVEIDEKFSHIKVKDEGKGFDWMTILSQKDHVELNVTRTSGRGISLMSIYGFNVSYNEKGNLLVLDRRQ